MKNNLKLKLLTLNANSITPHKLEFQTTLNDHDIDIAMIFESHLIPTKFIKILDYKAYQSNHPDTTVYAKSAILVKNNFIHSSLSVKCEIYLQTISILVSLNTLI